MTSQPPIIILENIRSAMNVGSILRSAACFSVSEVWSIGTTPHTEQGDYESRLPHVVRATRAKIVKTSLGAEDFVKMTHFSSIEELLKNLGHVDQLLVFERTLDATPMTELQSNPQAGRSFWLFGNEVNGVSQQAIEAATTVVTINQTNNKESLNVAVSAAVAMHWSYTHSQLSS